MRNLDRPTTFRRDFLKCGLVAGASLLGSLLRSRAVLGAWNSPQAGSPRSTAVIWLWMGGGQSQTDTWDPKPDTPSQGPFKAIETAVEGIRISELLPRCARQMGRMAILRSMNSDEINPILADWLMHVGFHRIQDTPYPPIGTVIAHELGKKGFSLPKYVALSPPAIPEDGLLDEECRPFRINDLDSAFPDARRTIGEERGRDREALLLEQSSEWERQRLQPETRHQARSAAKAREIQDSPLLNAFDLTQEPDAVRKPYGGEFGQRCLLSRRLVAAGCPFVEIGLPGWGETRNYFAAVKALSGELDDGLASLLADLDRSGLIERTLVVCAGPFGRGAKITEGQGREPQARGWSVVLAGGPIQGGRVIGNTGPEGHDCASPVRVPTLFSTIYQACGINPSKKFGLGYCVDQYVYPHSPGLAELLRP